MSVVYKLTDTRDLKIDNIVVTIRPLDYKTKSDMQALIMSGKYLDSAILGLKHGVKDIKGLKNPDGTDYELSKSEDAIEESSINDILNIPEASKLNVVALALINGMPQKEFVDPETGKSLSGVSFVKEKSTRKK